MITFVIRKRSNNLLSLNYFYTEILLICTSKNSELTDVIRQNAAFHKGLQYSGNAMQHTGVDPRPLERGFLCIKVHRGFALLILSYFSQISHENEIIWSHRIFFK